MSDFRKQTELCETLFYICGMAFAMLDREEIEVKNTSDLFATVYHLAQNYEHTNQFSETYVDDVEAYARKCLMRKYGYISKLHGRVWWDIEQQDFIGETQLYDEYLVMRHDGLTFEEYIRGCQTSENGTLELVKED